VIPIEGRNPVTERSEVYGQIIFSSGLIPGGWTIRITAVNDTDYEKPKPVADRHHSNDCGDQTDSSDSGAGDDGRVVASIAFDMTIWDPKGRERTLQELLRKQRNASVTIQLRYSIPKRYQKYLSKKQRLSLQYIYLEDGDDAWSYLNNDATETDNQTLRSSSFGTLSTRLDHLTSLLLSYLLIVLSCTYFASKKVLPSCSLLTRLLVGSALAVVVVRMGSGLRVLACFWVPSPSLSLWLSW